MMKSNVETIIRRSSLVVMMISGIISVFIILSVIFNYPRDIEIFPKVTRNLIREEAIARCLCAAVLFVAAFIFFRIFRSGRPFTDGNIWAVRSIAGLFVIKGLVPLAVKSLYSEGFMLGVPRLIVAGIGDFFIAGLLLLFAEIMRYGKLLQNESDETL
ncbi:MAG: DUF2975 domain-containing protein [Ruminococcus sp.]|uniref:DUF2975 domain-containing protein n=1 Tax=Ruminococcus sp. TaxID=41978 RepID=UPI0025D22624|nr:DUF2975 domain-containing protein [Ruminococcus sp.]MCR5599959.1 DUF2975 domain-containing protein [Ruminococcus sp.]